MLPCRQKPGILKISQYRDSAQNQEASPHHMLRKKSCLGDFTVGWGKALDSCALVTSAQMQAPRVGHLTMCPNAFPLFPYPITIPRGGHL